MERCIVHNKYRFRLWPLSTVLEKLLDKRFEELSISRPGKNAGYQDTVLRIRWQYLVALATMELGYLDWCHTEWCPAASPISYTLITSRFVNENYW